MENLKRYNLYLLAAIGTLALLMSIVGLIYFAVELFRYNNYNEPKAQILSEEKAKNLAADSIREQVISFKRVELVDSNRLYYIIPVGQAQLEEAEMYGLTNRSKSNYIDGDSYKAPGYNNILFYDAAGNKTTPLFNKRVSVNSFDAYYVGSDAMIHFSVTDVDSNRDGFMSKGDLQKLYIFLPSSGRFFEVEAAGKTFYRLFRLGKTNDFIAEYGSDRNNNGRFESSSEPYGFYRLNIQNGRLTEIIPDSLIEQLQYRLDGR